MLCTQCLTFIRQNYSHLRVQTMRQCRPVYGLVRHPALLQALKILTPLVRRLGPNANPGKLKELPVKGALMWAFFAGRNLHIAQWFEAGHV